MPANPSVSTDCDDTDADTVNPGATAPRGQRFERCYDDPMDTYGTATTVATVSI